MDGEEGMMPVVITTAHRGVFFGYVKRGTDLGADVIRIERARNCLYWSEDVGGFMGLGSRGPSKDCRVGPDVPAITLRNVTSGIECSERAREAWERAPWSK